MSKLMSFFSFVFIGILANLSSASEARAAGSAVVGSQATTFAFFGVFLALTLGVCAWAARRTSSTDEYLAASSSVTAMQNGLAIAGDYMSAGSFLGLTGAIYASGLDGFFLAATYLASWPVVLFLVAEPLRRLGRYSLADVLAHKLNERPIRVLSATCSLTIICFYLVAQLVGAGELLGLLAGVSYRVAVLGGGALMIALAIFGGMRGATWVQIIKAVLMLIGGSVIATLSLSRFGFDMGALLHKAVEAHSSGPQILNIRGFAQDGIATTSLAIGVLFGTAGLPHILMRFLTVRDERAARLSVFYATCLIGLFFIMLLPIGFASISLLRDAQGHLGPNGSVIGGTNMVAVHLADIVGGSALMGFITAVAFATILAVVCGLLIAGASAATNDLIAGLRGRSLDERSKLIVVRLTAAILGVIAIALAIAFEGQNVAYLIAMATSIAASANFPLLMLAIYWPGLSTAGALAGGAFGLISSVTLTMMGPTVWTKVLGLGPAPFPYDSPAILTVPAVFLICCTVSFLKRPSMDLAPVDLAN
jgi:cation/acetate symporter